VTVTRFDWTWVRVTLRSIAAAREHEAVPEIFATIVLLGTEPSALRVTPISSGGGASYRIRPNSAGVNIGDPLRISKVACKP